MSDVPSSMKCHGKRFILFSVVGVFNTGVDFIIYVAGVMAGLPPALANFFAFGVANPSSYVMNSRMTFRGSNGPTPLSVSAYGKFLLAHGVSFVLSTVCVVVLTPIAGPYLAKAAAVAATVFINYAASAFVVFRRGV